MFKVFFLVFLMVPLIELYVLIEVGSVIGAVPTILLTIATAIIGAALMRSQGMMTLQKAQQSLAAGQVPQTEMVEGILIFVGGLFLLIPGLITDFIGFLFLIPPIRQRFAKSLILQRQHQFQRHGQNVYETEWDEKSEDGQSIRHVRVIQSRSRNDDVIEGEILDSDNKK